MAIANARRDVQIRTEDQYLLVRSEKKHARVMQPLSYGQKRILKNVEKNEFENTVTRIAAYVQVPEHHQMVRRVVVPTQDEKGSMKVSAFCGCFVGIGVGGAVGELAGPPGAAVGTLAGAAAGAVVGYWGAYGVITAYKMKQIQNSPGYQSWKKLHLETLKNKIVSEFVKKDRVLKYFLCPISGELPLVPVKLRGTQLVFDFKSIREWTAHNYGKAYPGTNIVPDRLSNFVFDNAHVLTILDRLEMLFNYSVEKTVPLHARQQQELRIHLLSEAVVKIAMDYVNVLELGRRVDVLSVGDTIQEGDIIPLGLDLAVGDVIGPGDAGVQREVIISRGDHIVLRDLRTKIAKARSSLRFELDGILKRKADARARGDFDEFGRLTLEIKEFLSKRKKIVDRDSCWVGEVKDFFGFKRDIVLSEVLLMIDASNYQYLDIE